MSGYHKYVFDTNKRYLVGKFDEMYKNESKENFDSWHQEDSRQLNRKIDLAIFEQWNFRSIVDIGCGKGALTHLLKKRNNVVLGVDISETAVQIANSRFPDIEFHVLDLRDVPAASNFLAERRALWGGIDLVFSSECLSYIENWRELLGAISRSSKYLLVSLYLPENPIGFVKTPEELELAIAEHYTVIECVRMMKSRFVVAFGESNAFQDSV